MKSGASATDAIKPVSLWIAVASAPNDVPFSSPIATLTNFLDSDVVPLALIRSLAYRIVVFALRRADALPLRCSAFSSLSYALMSAPASDTRSTILVGRQYR